MLMLLSEDIASQDNRLVEKDGEMPSSAARLVLTASRDLSGSSDSKALAAADLLRPDQGGLIMTQNLLSILR